MDGTSHQNYLPEDMAFADLINNGVWPPAATEEQYTYPQQPVSQDQYQQYQTPNRQPTYSQFELQQGSYPQVQIPYSSSPYGNQFGHNQRPTDLYTHTPYADPSLNASTTYPGSGGNFQFESQPNNHATIAPQTLQYNIPPNQPISRAVSNSPFSQPAVNPGNVSNFNSSIPDQSAMYFNNFHNTSLQQSSIPSLQYSAVTQAQRTNESKSDITRTVADAHPSIATDIVTMQQVKQTPPTSHPIITHPDILASKDRSYQIPLSYAPFLAVKDQPIQVQVGPKNVLPKYHPRKAASGRDLVPGFDVSRTSTPKSASKRGRPPKDKSTIPKWTGTSKAVKAVADRLNTLREGSSTAKSPSPLTEPETSSSEEESSSEEDSEYEEEMPVVNISEVRGAQRPTDYVGGVRWDAIGVVWRDPYMSLADDLVRTGITEYAAFVGKFRASLKENAAAIETSGGAAGQSTTVMKLKAERKNLLDGLYEAIQAGVEHGYESIIKNMGTHTPFVNCLSATLIDCYKADDWNGKLPKAALKLLCKIPALSDELLKKIKFDGISKRFNKKGDAEIQALVTAINSNTVEAKAKLAAAEKKAKDEKIQKALADRKERELKEQQTKKRIADAMKATAVTNAGKRPHDGDGANGNPTKKLASGVSAAVGLTKSNPIRRPTANLLGIASKPAAKPAARRPSSPPPQSKLNAILDSIASEAKPKAVPAAPPRAPETPEEKTRRERKESRRHLRVKFKEGSELEQIRLFKHEQGEDEGRQDDMLRDANDSHNEGMMHKQRASEVVDEADEEEYQPPEFMEAAFTEPVNIDFSSSNKTTKFGPSYTTRGGDLEVATPEQETQQRREAVELIVVYTDPNEIPPTAKEPFHDLTSKPSLPVELKPPVDSWLVQRCQEIAQYGPKYANQMFHRRYQELKATMKAPISVVSPSQAPPSDPRLAGMTPAEREKYYYDNLAKLMANIKSLKGKPYPATEPPEWMQNPTQRAEWIEGYNRGMAAKQSAASEQSTTVQPALYQSVPPALSAQYQTPPTLQFPPPMIQNPFAPDGNLYSEMGGHVNGDFGSWAPNNALPASDINDKRPRPDDNWNNEGGAKAGRFQGNNNHKNKRFRNPDSNDGSAEQSAPYTGKKYPCTYFLAGRCTKGALCTYSHEK